MKPIADVRPALVLWHSAAGAAPVRSEASAALVLGAGGARVFEHSMPAGAPVLVPVAARGSQDGVLAALVRPWGKGRSAPSALAVNGVQASAGMHLLYHADRIQLEQQIFWVAVASAARDAAYDPAVHGADLFCFRTKARFEPGDPLVVCPGSPERPCGMMYAKRAWDLGLTCHACGSNPGAPEWEPPRSAWAPSSQASAVDRLLELARARAQLGDLAARGARGDGGQA